MTPSRSLSPPRMYQRLRCFLPAKKVNVAIKLHNCLVGWHRAKVDRAYAKTDEGPWASLSTMNKLMGWKDEIRERYTIMELKKALNKADLIWFISMKKASIKLGRRFADKFLFLESKKPQPVVFAGKKTHPGKSQVLEVEVHEKRESLLEYYRRLMVA